MTIRSWIAASRPLAHANIAPPLLLGQALAIAQGVTFTPWLSVVAFSFGVLDHLFIVFTNDYADREADALHRAPTLVSGGSRVIQEGRLSAEQVRNAAIASALALVLFSAMSGWLLARPWLVGFSLVAIALLVLYSVRPFALAYRGFGEILQALGVGAVLPLVGYYLQAGSFDDVPISALAPLVIVGFASNILTALPDTEADRAANKRAWPVRRTEPKARRDALALLALALVLTPFTTPALEPTLDVFVVGPPALAWLFALFLSKNADSIDRRACLRFVLIAAGVGGLLHLSWSAMLWTHPS